jgi:hypothetical protein
MVWFSSLVLIAGVIVFVTVRWGSTDVSTTTPPPSGTTIDGTNFDPGPATTPRKLSEVPKGARIAAGQFILAAVGREDLRQAWKLTHPELKEQCACSYKEWLTGNIPIQPYPTAGLRGVSYAVDELSPRRVVLEVLLKPKVGSEVEDQAFHLGLKAVGKGKQIAWLVDLWAPIVAIPIPTAPGSG